MSKIRLTLRATPELQVRFDDGVYFVDLQASQSWWRQLHMRWALTCQAKFHVEPGIPPTELSPHRQPDPPDNPSSC